MAEAKPTPEKAEHKRRRKSKAADTPEGDGAADWVPKGKSWENDISRVDTIIRDTDDGLLYAYLHWTNGKKSKVSLERCYQKCPMKVGSPWQLVMRY